MIRRMGCPIAVALVTALSATPVPAQDYPNRTIRIIVQTQPGGLIDQIGRTLAQKLTENTGAVVVVENRTGGGGLIAAEHVINSPADGYTLYIGLARLAGDPSAPHQEPVVRSGEGVRACRSMLATTPTLLVMNPSVPAKTLQELIALHQGQSRQVHLRVAGQRLVRPCHRRAVQAARRRRPRARALQGRGAGGARSRRRPCLGDVRHHRVLAGAGDRREAARSSRSAPTRA